MFVKVKSHEQQEGFLGYKYVAGKDVWVNTDNITGFNDLDNMCVIYSPLPFGKTFITKQDMEKIKKYLSLEEE